VRPLSKEGTACRVVAGLSAGKEWKRSDRRKGNSQFRLEGLLGLGKDKGEVHPEKAPPGKVAVGIRAGWPYPGGRPLLKA